MPSYPLGYYMRHPQLGAVRVIPVAHFSLLSPTASSPNAVFSPLKPDADANLLPSQNSNPY